MAPVSAFLKAPVLDEAKHGTVATYTFGGTNTALVRVRDWAFTAGSALPQRHGSPPKVEFTGKRSRSLSSVRPMECRTLQLLLQKFGWEKGDLLVATKPRGFLGRRLTLRTRSVMLIHSPVPSCSNKCVRYWNRSANNWRWRGAGERSTLTNELSSYLHRDHRGPAEYIFDT